MCGHARVVTVKYDNSVAKTHRSRAYGEETLGCVAHPDVMCSQSGIDPYQSTIRFFSLKNSSIAFNKNVLSVL